MPAAASTNATGSTGAVTAKPTPLSGGSSSPERSQRGAGGNRTLALGPAAWPVRASCPGQGSFGLTVRDRGCPRFALPSLHAVARSVARASQWRATPQWSHGWALRALDTIVWKPLRSLSGFEKMGAFPLLCKLCLLAAMASHHIVGFARLRHPSPLEGGEQ
jgi:hypothetical protein